MDSNPAPSGNVPPGAKVGIGGFLAMLVGIGLLISPITSAIEAHPAEQSSSICKYFADRHPDIDPASIHCGERP